ncbi:hypothetical protein, partial [Kribbella aluminosa]|uniref:hypothetical protein n=1 Tax=Kribbella aluminosa TaxID=416017 RepID=UPI0031E36D9F
MNAVAISPDAGPAESSAPRACLCAPPDGSFLVPPDDSYDLDDLYDVDGSCVPRYLSEEDL